MSNLLLMAAALLVAMGLIHSVLGELLLLRKLPPGPTLPGVLGGPSLPTLRAAWHTLTLLGWGLARLLTHLAWPGAPEADALLTVIAATLLLCAVAWLVVTRGRHVAWVGFLLAAVLCWAATGGAGNGA